jgi:hypothetical protein
MSKYEIDVVVWVESNDDMVAVDAVYDVLRETDLEFGVVNVREVIEEEK